MAIDRGDRMTKQEGRRREIDENHGLMDGWMDGWMDSFFHYATACNL
jgi:hypothetical protein